MRTGKNTPLLWLSAWTARHTPNSRYTTVPDLEPGPIRTGVASGPTKTSHVFIEQLPDELLLAVWSWLAFGDKMALRATNRRWHALSASDLSFHAALTRRLKSAGAEVQRLRAMAKQKRLVWGWRWLKRSIYMLFLAVVLVFGAFFVFMLVHR